MKTTEHLKFNTIIEGMNFGFEPREICADYERADYVAEVAETQKRFKEALMDVLAAEVANASIKEIAELKSEVARALNSAVKARRAAIDAAIVAENTAITADRYRAC